MNFYSKILLFGEYSIIEDSMGLAMPYQLFAGHLAFRNNRDHQDSELKSLASYVQRLSKKNALKCDLDLSSFRFDIGQGLYFKSTIPQGHGAGSSGALCAAIYDRYAKNKETDVCLLKEILAQLESHFHGSSSGIDPLVSYLKRPLLIRNRNEVVPVELPNYNQGKGALFLLNTGRARKTEPLVNLFLEKYAQADFKKLCKTVLAEITNDCIDAFSSGEVTRLYSSFYRLSAFQRQYLAPMIPPLYTDLWEQGLASEKFLLKLCGAGGGGFLLGICKDFEAVKNELSEYEMRVLISLNF